MANNIIKGRKGGGSKQRTPTEQPDDLQSVAKAKILLALGEGEFAGGLTGKDIYLDGTPLENADGSQNFSGVSWEFRPGTQAQTYIQGIPGTENEISVGTEVSSKTAWTHTFTNTQLSAVRVRLKWPSLMKQEDDGDVVGNTVKYAIDLQTDGGAWQTVLETAVTGKTTSGYERSHRIDLPQAGSTWTLRLRKISPDANSVKVGDVMTLQSYTEVIDAKLRYPNTALLYIEFDSSQFNGSIPQISCEPRGRVIRVPDNYNPETREYTGVWTGGFKWAWTDNPAWIYYDIVTADRFGLGNRLSSANISKWTLYQIAQYCDQLVPDGRGGDGMEPRYTCNVYVQERNDAYTVLRDFAAIFRGMTCWNGEQIVVQADMPRDVDFTYTRANIIGKPRYSSSSSQVRYTNALVSWSDPDNAYADAMEPAFIPELVSRYSFNQLELTSIGCTRQSEAHRKGLWGILTNNKDRVVEFDVGLDGRIPQPGYIIALADELLAGRVNGGRISAVNGRVITLDRDVDAKPGDRLQLNLPSGISQSRTIQAVNGRRQITVTTAYSETPERECVWAVESNDLFLQQYRVTGVKENGDATLTITGVSHDPDKFARIDTGAIIDQRPVSVLPAGNQSPPDDIVITSRSVVNQGISVETMQVNWSAVSGAIAYEAQWRRNDGNWINVPRSSTTSFEVSGIYAGRYLVRVRAINAAEISSGWAYSEEKTLTGKVGEPLAPLALATRSLVHGVQVSWEFPTGSGDTLRTELQYSKNQDGSAPMPLSDVAYPGKSYQQMGLSMGAEFWYRARLVDRLGNESPWTGWVQGMASDNFDDYYENLTDAIKDTDAWEETQRTISETQEGIRNTQQELEQTAEELRQEAADQAKQVSQDIDASAKSITADVDGKISAVNKTITDELTSVNESLDSGLAQANKGIQEAKSAVADANQQIAILSKSLADGDAALNAQIKTAENGLKQSLSQVNTTLTNAVKQETADRIADVNAKAAQAADELLAATQGIEASIESLTQVMKSADENLAREMSSLAAGANIQFDSHVIWHFNNQTTEGWTGSAGVPGVSQDGWLRPADSATDPYITSPGGLAVNGAAYRFIMLRFRKTGKPVWAGEIRWVSAGENFNNTKRYIVAEPEYADGVATLTVRDIPWTGNIDRIRLDLTNQQDASNFIEFDWIAVGRPAPGASTAALQDVRSTLSNALTAEAQARSTLAAQMRGSYEGSDLEKVTSGLLYQEKTARVTAISAEVKARESLQTQFNDNKAAVSGELSSLTTEQSAQASRIGGLETSLGKKADATALTSLTQKVEQQGATLTSQGAALTSLTNRMGQTETGLAGTNEALSGLESTVTQQGDRITSQGQSITKLTSDLGTTNAALAKKAEASAVTALTQQVEQNGQDIRSNTDSITSLSNQLVNGQPNSWSRRIYTVQLANAGTVPSFSDIRAVAPVVVDEAADAAKLDFTSSGSYLIALYSCQVKVAADTTITMAPGNRVFDDTGAVFVNGVQVAWGNASWTTGSFDLKAGWNTVEFLVNQWTGQAYINLGLKLSDKVAEMYSGLGVSALANAAGVLSSNVSQIGNDVVSNSQSITQLRNALTQTDANVASKADQTAMNSLTGRVEKTESGLTAANANITSLKSAVRAGNASGGDLIPNPTFDPTYDQMGFSVVSTTAEDVPSGCPYGYAARIASRDHHPNFAAFPATLNDVIEISALVACGAGTANFNLYVGTAVRPDTSTGAPLMAGGGKSPSATWQRTTWRFKVTQAMVDRGYIRPFLQISQNSPYGTVWFVTDWHMRNVTAAQKVQDTADATAAAVDSLTTTVTQQGNLLTSTGNRTTQLENGLATTNAAVAKKADATAVQDLTNTVKQLGNDLTAANSAITKLTGNLANTDKALAQKADATALATLDTKVMQQGKTLESQSNSLTNLSNSLSQVAADIDASGQIPGNLVVNPSFERGLDGYTGRSTATSVVEVSAPHSGTRALKVDPGSVSPGQYIPFVQGRTYEIGVWVKEPGATTDNGAGNNKLRIGNSAGQPVFERPYNSGTVGTNWSLISGRWKATETASLPVTMSNYLISGSRYFDDFYVTDVTDRVDIDATAGAVTGLTNRVSTAEGHITSQSQQLTNLQNSLNTTNAALAKKAEASAVTALTQQVEQNGQDIRSNTDSITSLSNQLVNGQPNSWSRRIYTVQLANAGTVPSFSDIRAVAPVVVDEVADAAKLDFTSAGSYLIALYSCQVKVAADTTITMAPGNRIFDDTGAVFVNGVQVAWGNASWTTGSFELKAGWNTVEFLVNQWTGQAYINLGLKLSDKVAEMYSGLGVSALANAAGVLSSNVSQIGNDVVSNSQIITQLRNALTQTDANVASKADQTAMNSLTGRVEKTESGLTAANSNITSLSSSLSQQSKRGANLLPDGTFESYAVGHNLANNRAIVTTDDSHGGNKCIRVTRPNDYNANATDNTDTHIFSGFQVRDNAVFYMECWVKLDAKSTAMAENVQISVGLSLQYQDNSWQWPAVTKAAKDLSSTQWTKVSGYLKSTKSGIKQAMVRISIPNVSSVKAGNSFLIDDLVITEVTDAYNAQSTADANANAISTLNSTVSQQGDQITSQGNSITKLTNDLATTNNNVSNKADANALTALTNRVTQTEKDINSTSSSVTNLNNKVDSISVGGTNLIKNSGDMTGWSNVTSETYRGNAVIGATVKAGSGYKDLREITLESPVDAGEYVYSFYAKGGVAGQTMTAFFYNPNTTTSIETSQGAKGNNTDGRAYFTLTTSWVRYWVKWKQTPTTGTKRLILCRIESNTSKDQTVYINSPKFEVGNVVSDWNDSPADSASASAVDLLTTTVNQQGTSISSIGNRTTSLENGLSTAQNNIARKADASALQDLRNTVTSQGGDLTAANSSITSLQASMNRRTVFTVTARGNGNSVTPGVFDESGKNLFTPGRSWALVTFAKHSDGSTVIATSKTYDVFGSANNGATMSADIEALASGTYVCVLTFDEPSGNRGKILSALESLGGTSEVVNSLPYRGAYILLGRKGMRSGDGLELRAPTGGDATAHISTSVEFVNGIMMGLGAAGGVMMKADANASAITTLQNTVKTQGGNIDSLSSSITALENSLRSTNDTVSKKADTTAVSSLTGRVSQVENTITSQSQSITSLTSSINTISTQGANPWVDGTFESYGDGHVLGGGGTAVVVASQKFTGNKSLQVSRGANNNGNSDKQLGSWQSVREDAKFRFEFWAMMPADQAPSSGWTTLVGINSLNAAGQNSWQSAVTVSEAALGARDKWVKFTGIASNNGGGRTRAVVWISTRGASGSGTPGYSLYIDDLVITDVTDAKAAQDASDAKASAVSGLTARVTDAEGKITAQAQQQTALATKVDNANSRVDNMAKTLSDSQSTQASLNTSLQSQIDAQAAANIKNQTTLDNTIKSVASITSTQQTHATALEALATQQTTLTSSVGDLSASVQNTAKTVADVNGTVSSLWSMKVETVNGKNVGAGITLGSNGETSDMILYADRFSLFNRNNATAVPVMVAEGNELYIDTARIKNSSLTSAKIADGSITNAKIGNEIRSNNFVDGSQGWRIAKDGSSQFNNVIVRGRVEANSGVFRGTVQADSFIGDIAVAKSYDSLTFRRNQTVQRNGAYQNRGYSMTVVLACTLVCQTYGTGSGLGYTSDITFNIGGQEVTRRIFVDAGNITGGTTAFELRFAARLDADYNNVGFFIRASGRTAAIDYTCTVENITATAFRTDSSSFS
ncbi:Chromosome partition protein Smc [Klebsiella pneumoniae]|nr:Chromosome partition protein Smc [Klebsiella pneumoniae]CAF9571791.1 Chromosome partition protein Smc [Klebsiella pneumoniae]CAH6123311.1 Chromosome partition protein Smc [Klebsiella pneumoniae]CAH6124759.1 Chromosome partition protein Smc [Klebsiella pneumoniae]